MRVTLGYPHDGHQPDDTIDVPDEQGRQLLLDGVARPADPPAGDTPTPPEPSTDTTVTEETS